MIFSKDQKFRHAVKDINNFDTVQEVLDHIAGDERVDILDAAKLRIAEIDPEHPFLKAPEKQEPEVRSQESEVKQGQVQKITQPPAPLPEFKMIRKEAKSSVITIRDGKAVTVAFDHEGKEIKG